MRKFLLLPPAALAFYLALSASAQAPLPNPLVGADACGQCHPGAMKAWLQSPHARANSRLPAANRADSRCIRCHGLAGSEAGCVQCETCHGPGRMYAKRYVMKDKELSRLVGLTDAKLEDCRRCHTDTSPGLSLFAPEQAWLLVRHGQEPKPEPAKPDAPRPAATK